MELRFRDGADVSASSGTACLPGGASNQRQTSNDLFDVYPGLAKRSQPFLYFVSTVLAIKILGGFGYGGQIVSKRTRTGEAKECSELAWTRQRSGKGGRFMDMALRRGGHPGGAAKQGGGLRSGLVNGRESIDAKFRSRWITLFCPALGENGFDLTQT